ncbi:NAD-dependent formate dehydrogenase [Klebsiella pneumoniae]|uniref:NAD-dependent formate dehydrogenase n=1 Tax=Klebsiella TaxID=570 RepID=UPI000329B010|nr:MULTISPECIES: NAD-dependent formate dehydrogenase [Klebsiella]EJA9211364.1 NAD-dependent formate dehydrogenase [Escherichia coli]HBY1220057.1 NAD-dependent formate dehydrogenase [Klebsiella aerogenes]EIW9594278.1 NAD-dependent formate dehydrogenase [Klebsiella pneumoniae]MCT8891407.1 NAD-dependent formate dehydrogenase [Klebsiella quasipneumoniae subsp. similipneumoniae]HBV3324372.1 NAD-dependent formate dehydrogenase [Klebsiella pneumoniae]
MATILCVLYPDPTTGYPPVYAREDIPAITQYANGQRAPVPVSSLGFKPGQLLGCVSGELGLREWAETHGHELIVTSDKDGPESAFERFLPDADIVISQPFWPAYLTRDRIEKASKLKLALTAGIGSDHVDLDAAAKAGITVAEVTGSNSISVAEHVVMMVLSLVRNYLPSHQISADGGWNIADCVTRSYDVEGMHFGTIGAGRIGLAVLRRLKAFDMPLHYTQRHRLASSIEEELGLTYHPDAESLARTVDIVNLQVPLYPSTERFFNQKMISEMKRGSYLINTARAQLVDRDAIVNALESGHLAGYAGDVWYPQPAPVTHPWRTMPWNGMTPHMSGTSLSAQARYAAGTLEILESFLGKLPIREEYLIVDHGQLAGTGAKSYQLN